MSSSKLGRFMILGAFVGAGVSMFDRKTREQVGGRAKSLATNVAFYSKNPDVLKFKIQEKKVKYQMVYDQLAGDASYIKAQVEELKTLTPQVKELVVNTKDTFVESKDEYKAIVSETST